MVTSECSASRPSPAASQGANPRTFAAPNEAAKQRASAGAAGNGNDGALPFAFQLSAVGGGFNLALPAVDGHGNQPYVQHGAAFEMAHAFGIHYGPVGRRA